MASLYGIFIYFYSMFIYFPWGKREQVSLKALKGFQAVSWWMALRSCSTWSGRR